MVTKAERLMLEMLKTLYYGTRNNKLINDVQEYLNPKKEDKAYEKSLE